MNDTDQFFLGILRGAILGETPRLPEHISREKWQTLFQLAELHNVQPLIYGAVHGHPSLEAAGELNAAVKRNVRRQVGLQAARTEAFLQLNDRLLEAGLEPLVVKGILCRHLYPRPDARPSADEDVLIPQSQITRCHEILAEFGMGVADSAENLSQAYQVPYRGAGSPLYIEMHRHLFPPESDAYGELNRLFSDVRQRAITVQIQGHCVLTLGYTDHLLYMLCHGFKHFLHSGFGIRQICDIGLYANAYGNDVDWMRILEACRAIRGEKFAAAVFTIAGKYLGFEPHKAGYPAEWQAIAVDEAPMLADLLAGGLYGDATMSRKHSSNITLEAVAADRTGRKARNAVAVSVFPAAERLQGRYPYLKKHPWLLPVAWCSRLLAYGREIDGHRDNRAADALRIGSERVELLKFYGILP